jgi:hypothetical protein
MLTTLGPSAQPSKDQPLSESSVSSPSDKKLSVVFSFTAVTRRRALLITALAGDGACCSMFRAVMPLVAGVAAHISTLYARILDRDNGQPLLGVFDFT